MSGTNDGNILDQYDDQNQMDPVKFESYQKNKELHFLQMRESLRNSFMNRNKMRLKDSVTNKSHSGLSHLPGTFQESSYQTSDKKSNKIGKRSSRNTSNTNKNTASAADLKFTATKDVKTHDDTSSKPVPHISHNALHSPPTSSSHLQRVSSSKNNKRSYLLSPNENIKINAALRSSSNVLLNGYEFDKNSKQSTSSKGNIFELVHPTQRTQKDRLSSALMKKYRSIEKIKDVITSHRDRLPESEKKRSVSRHLKAFHVPVRNSKMVEQREYQQFLVEHVKEK